MKVMHGQDPAYKQRQTEREIEQRREFVRLVMEAMPFTAHYGHTHDDVPNFMELAFGEKFELVHMSPHEADKNSPYLTMVLQKFCVSARLVKTRVETKDVFRVHYFVVPNQCYLDSLRGVC